jgi:VWFA-related protein
MKRFAIMTLATILAAVAAVPAGPAGASTAVAAVPPPTVKPFGESIDVRVVNVEAVVTDGKGGRVRGLTAADFRLLVDGREVPIDYFTEIASGAAAAPAAARSENAEKAPAAAAAPTAPAAPATIAAPGEAVGTNYLVYIDDQFSIRPRRNLVLEKLKADLGHLGVHDQMAILSFDGHKVTRLIDWTGDRKALEAGIATAEARPTFGLLALAEARSDGDESQMVEETGSAIVSLGWGIDVGIRAAVAAMRGTPTPPGRKVMLFFNGGWGLPDLPQSDTGAPSAVNLPEAAKIFAPVFETANLLGYTLYTIEVPNALSLAISNDVRIATPSIPLTFSNSMSDLGRNEVLIPPGLTLSEGFITSSIGRSLHENLEVMANQTGGKAMLNSAWQNAFERVAADTSSYYWLGFTPQWKADGSHHEIRLEARRPGLTVRSRSGFSDLSRETEAQVQAESLLLYGVAKSERPLTVTAGVLRRVSFLRRELPVTIEVPADALAPQVEEGRWSLVGTLSIAILDKGGKDPRWRTLPVHFKSNGLPPAGATTSVQTVLKLPRSTRQVVFAVGGEHGEVRAWTLLDLPGS